MDPKEPVVIHTVTVPAEAEMICNLLRSEGIVCEISGENQAGLAGVLEIGILVKAEDADRADKIVRERILPPPPSGTVIHP